MNVYETKWVQGAMVVLLEQPVDSKEIVRQTDYVILQMTGKIAHRAQSLPEIPKKLPPRQNFSNWPFKD
ncbi:protein of unknown function [Ralstonia solanacearum CMR15]|nr:protein of unknown function [Ralstonia solanacearum CMR15]